MALSTPVKNDGNRGCNSGDFPQSSGFPTFRCPRMWTSFPASKSRDILCLATKTAKISCFSTENDYYGYLYTYILTSLTAALSYLGI